MWTLYEDEGRERFLVWLKECMPNGPAVSHGPSEWAQLRLSDD